MLVLTREESEEIVISDNNRITMSKISGSRIRLAIANRGDIDLRRSKFKCIQSDRGKVESRGNLRAVARIRL